MPDSPTTKLLTPTQVAERLRVSPRTVVRWARAGRIPEIRASDRVRRFDWGDVLSALTSTRTQNGGAR